MPLIDASQTFALGAALAALVAFGMWAERQTWGQQVGGPLILIALAMGLANTGVLPHAAPLYDSVGGLLVPMAIPLLLLRANFRAIFRESGPMFGAFLLAAAATVAGALVGALLIDIGPLEPQLVGTVTSSYIGGSLNFVATAEAVGIRDSSIYVAALSADAVGAVFFLLTLMLLPALRFVRAAMPSRFIGAGAQAGSIVVAEPREKQPFDLAGATNGLALSLSVCALSVVLTGIFGMDSLFILVVTALSLAVANFARPLVRRVSADFEIGTLFMYLFFVTIGAGANIADVLGAALPILLFIVVMVVTHLVLLVIAGRLLKLDLAEVMIASNACILGPAPAAALAASKGWQPLVAPGILVGMFGYAIATFIGVALSALLAA
ncbi:MAG: DUF819 family protein [Gammaproteobacteria bacterium]|nr:DUF819 family protein [Gammaproteobacteria bacterium]MDH4255633.1 DUF819 family protein [Gammaproteobacteria bacterium]MDH5311167.1 DUF819 family protein [Gammaproteobacteria bacterium]